MRTDDIYSATWDVARVFLRRRFAKGIIAFASRRDLERALIILAHAGEKDPWPKETEDFRSAISVLLQVKAGRQIWILTLICAACGIIQAFGVFLDGFSLNACDSIECTCQKNSEPESIR